MTVTRAISAAAIFAGLTVGGAVSAHADNYRENQYVGEAGSQASDGLHIFWATQQNSGSEAVQTALAKCLPSYSGCFSVGSTTQCISTVAGSGDRYYFQYGMTAQAAINAALAKAGSDAKQGPREGHCAWDVS